MVPFCCHFRETQLAVLKWWEETTDLQVLSSPWVCRPLGRALRIAWMAITIALWLYSLCNPSFYWLLDADHSSKTLLLILMWYFWVASFWFCFQAGWETFSGSLLFGLGGTACLWTLGNIGRSPAVFKDSAIFNITLVMLSHCNVHPVVLLPNICWSFFIITYTLVSEWKDNLYGFDYDPAYWVLQIYSEISACICFVAFSCDFAARVKTAFAIMEADGEADGNEPPVEIASGVRKPCWLAGVNNWFFWAWVSWIKWTHDRRAQGNYHYWKNHLPRYAMLLAPFLGLFCISLAPFLRRSHLLDVLLAVFCCLPATLLSVDWCVAVNTAVQGDDPMFYSFAHSLKDFASFQPLYCLEMLVSTGCHPLICLPPALIFLGVSLMTIKHSMLWMDMYEMVISVFDSTRFCCCIFCLQMVSYVWDYVRRKAALAQYGSSGRSVELAQR